METHATGQKALQAIFAVFLGLIITAVVGVGVYTFYPNPADATRQQLTELNRQQDDLLGCTSKTGCTAEEDLPAGTRAKLAQVRVEIRVQEDIAQAQERTWAQRSSIILITLATALMAGSLLGSAAFWVITNGMLLGGLFTMLYGVGWGIASGNSLGRLAVLVAALVISLALGYLRFVRQRHAGQPALAAVAAQSGDTAALEARIAALESRLAAAAKSLTAHERD